MIESSVGHHRVALADAELAQFSKHVQIALRDLFSLAALILLNVTFHQCCYLIVYSQLNNKYKDASRYHTFFELCEADWSDKRRLFVLLSSCHGTTHGHHHGDICVVQF